MKLHISHLKSDIILTSFWHKYMLVAVLYVCYLLGYKINFQAYNVQFFQESLQFS
jgi:hypothetical protein